MAFNNIYAKSQPTMVLRPWYVRHWGLASLMVTILIATMGALAWRPALNHWHAYKSRQLANEAQVFMKEGKWAEAAPLLEKAYVMDPKEPVTLRACAYYEEHGAKNLAFSGHFLKQLIALNVADESEKAAMGKALLASGRTNEARELHGALPADSRSTKEALELESQLARKQGESGKADELLRKALTKSQDDPASVLRLAVMDLSSPVPEIQQNAWDKLWKLANASAKESVSAIEKLSFHALTTPAQSAALMELASKKESVPPAVRYHAVSCFMRLHPSERDVVLNLETTRIQGKSDAEVEAFSQWLTDEEEYERVLKFLPFDKAVASSRLLPNHLNAMLRLGQWKELQNLLKDEKRLRLDALSLAELRAKCARGLDEPPSVVRGLLDQGREFAVAARNTGGLDRFADVSLAMGYPDIALACLKSITPGSPAQSEALLEKMMTIQRADEEMSGLLSTLREIAALPGTPTSRVEEFIYLRLIGGVELETALDDSAVFASKGSIRPLAADFFKALAAYRFDDRPALKAALAVIDPKALPANWRAVLAGMISESGDKARGFQIAEKIRGEGLSADEKKIFSSAL